MGEEAVLLRNVGLGSIADVLDGFYRQVLELTDEMREKSSAGSVAEAAESSAANEEAESLALLKQKMRHSPQKLEATLKRSAGPSKLPELLSKIKELESHSRGGPYEELLRSMSEHIESALDTAKGYGEIESQCALFGENFLLKPLVHYLSCWDVRERKKLREQVTWATKMRDQSYNSSIELVSHGRISEARESEAKSLECGEKALAANAQQRAALDKLERAAMMDLRAYETDGKDFLEKWESAYHDQLDAVTEDIDTLTSSIDASKERNDNIEQSFQRRLQEHAKRLTDNAHRRAKNLRDLQNILRSEVERERELKEEENALTLLQQQVEQWKRTTEASSAERERCNTLLSNSEEMLMNAISVVNRARQAEDVLNSTLSSQLGGRREALQKEKQRLAVEHYELAKFELKLLTRKGDRLRRRAEHLEKKRADCFFSIEMAYENETPVDELRDAKVAADRYAHEASQVRRQLEDLARLAKTVDNESLSKTLDLLGQEHPQRSIREELKNERQAYNDKIRQHLTDKMSQLKTTSDVHYVRQTPRELDEVTDHSISDSAESHARKIAVFSPMMSKSISNER